MDIAKTFASETDGLYECDDLTFETAVICENDDLNNLSEDIESLAAILTLESALLNATNDEDISKIVLGSNLYTDEDLTTEGALVAKTGLLNRIANIKDRIYTNIENSINTIRANGRAKQASAVEDMNELKYRIESSSDGKRFASNVGTINSYFGFFTTMGLNINSVTDVIKFIEMPRTVLSPLLKENVEFISKVSNDFDKEIASKFDKNSIKQGNLSRAFISSLKYAEVKNLDIRFAMPLRLVGKNLALSSFVYDDNKFKVTGEYDVKRTFKQQVNTISKSDALKVINAIISELEKNDAFVRETNKNIELTISVVKKMTSKFKSYKILYTSDGPVPVVDIDYSVMMQLANIYQYAGNLVTAGKMVIRANYDMKQFVKVYLKGTYL